MLKKLLFFAIFVSCFMFYTSPVIALDYKSDYQVEYFLSEDNKGINTKSQFTIQITNLRSDIYVNKFSLSFPKTFVITELKAFDDKREIAPNITVDDSKTKIDLEFSDPQTGKNSVNTFNLQFTQRNLFQVNGNVWEVILPTIENREEGNYKIIVHLPKNSEKKISIAKPKPTLVSGNEIIWDNPQTKTVYAVFGDFQLYDLKLAYHLANTNIYPVYTDVAFPPDTLYQKVFVVSIKPRPSLVFTDEDGNFLGRYFLKPKENINVFYSGVAELTVKPREEVIPVVRSLIAKQSKYLLTEEKYWKLDKVSKSLDSPYSVYRSTVSTLKYNYDKITKKNERLGALGALKSPNNAVCVEFSDLFIAQAREKGIYSREIEGYGFSQDPQLRPLSLVSDILHSWPEFYDKKSELWINVDPTWENTSGIDYFNSFDLNHVAFAIHGKRSDYPLPAGMYKTEDSRDVTIIATTKRPMESKTIEVSKPDFPNTISDQKELKAKITLINNGNVYLWNTPVQLKSDILNLVPSKTSLPLLAPFEKKEINFIYASKFKNKQIKGSIQVFASGNEMFSKSVLVIPYAYELSLKIASIVVTIFFIMLLVKIYISKKH